MFSYITDNDSTFPIMKFYIVLIFSLSLILCYGCQQKKSRQDASPEELIIIKTLGLAYLEENKLEEAEAEFLKLVELDPAEVLGYANLGVVYLRMGKYQDAEEWLKKAVKLDAEDPDVRLILAKVYEMSERPRESIKELEKVMDFSPGHVKSIYQLTELYHSQPDHGSPELQRKYLEELIGYEPGNLVPRLNLIELLISEHLSDQALGQMEQLRQIFPEFPRESIEFHDSAIAVLRSGDTESAANPFMVFHNYLKVTPPYQAGIVDLKGPGGSLIGFPLITFDQTENTVVIADWQTRLEAIKFRDITASAGLDLLSACPPANDPANIGLTYVAAGDYDGDGDIDLYAGHHNPESMSYRHYLLKNDWGVFSDVSEEAGVLHEGSEITGRFADYNNDGHADLFIVMDGANLLYRNNGSGLFEEVSKEAGVSDASNGNHNLFFDYDHDGDLDLYMARNGSNLMYRNNADEHFEEQSAVSGLAGGNTNSIDAGFGDFDDDGDIDIFIINQDASNALYSNQRQGVFRDVTEGSGLRTGTGSSAVSVGDYNNDGFLDLFVASSEGGSSKLYRNLGDGTFEEDHTSEVMGQDLQDVRVHDASLMDFDNDGYLDLLVVGEPGTENGKAAFLYHNDGEGKLWPADNILPPDMESGREILTFDYNDDGDLDIVLIGLDGNVRLLRNDGGNNNHYVKMKLVGLRTGSAKNNYYGIGAKVEIRSGNLYQSKVVTEPEIHFGLGSRETAEVIRILWTNGVPQNIFFPGTDQDLIEEQILKGSCPFLYAWNGESFEFVKDVMWRSALGMPLGIMGEAKAYASPEPSDDYIKIPGNKLKPRDGKYVIQITGELWETMYTDMVELVVLDHPESVDLYVNERLTPPDSPGYTLYQAGAKDHPVSAFDQHGTDLMPYISIQDDRYTPGFRSGKYQGITEISEIELDLGSVDPGKPLYLFTRGWIFPSDASINASIAQSDELQMISPYIQVINTGGEWETAVDDMSIPMGKDKTIVTDLSGKVNVKDPRIRIRTNMQLYWDHIFFTQDLQDSLVTIGTLHPVSADLHYRGFSRTYRKGGRYGPHWFDYSQVRTGPRWRDLTGSYTRYGDVQPLLLEPDDMYVIKNAGDEITIEFDATDLPQLKKGWRRDFLIHNVGWVKDGDLNTASGQTVDPLPFHGMSRYPYGPDETFHTDREHREYLENYNTRVVTGDAFREALVSGTIEVPEHVSSSSGK